MLRQDSLKRRCNGDPVAAYNKAIRLQAWNLDLCCILSVSMYVCIDKKHIYIYVCTHTAKMQAALKLHKLP